MMILLGKCAARWAAQLEDLKPSEEEDPYKQAEQMGHVQALETCLKELKKALEI